MVDNRRVAREVDRTCDSEAQVGDHPTFPSTDLVSEDAKSAKPLRSDRSFSDNAAIDAAVAIRYRRHLDRHLGAVSGRRDERGVKQVAARTPTHSGRDCLEESSEEPDDALAGAIARTEWDPVQVQTRIMLEKFASAGALRIPALHIPIVRVWPCARQGTKVRVSSSRLWRQAGTHPSLRHYSMANVTVTVTEVLTSPGMNGAPATSPSPP